MTRLRARSTPVPSTTLFGSEDQHAQADERHGVARDRPRAPVGPVLAATRAEEQQGRQAAGGADEGDHRRAGEVLHAVRSEEHTAELQSRQYLVCRLLLDKTY